MIRIRMRKENWSIELDRTEGRDRGKIVYKGLAELPVTGNFDGTIGHITKAVFLCHACDADDCVMYVGDYSMSTTRITFQNEESIEFDGGRDDVYHLKILLEKVSDARVIIHNCEGVLIESDIR